MASKPVSLTVHKNTRERRKRHQLRKDMVSSAREIGSERDIAGYVIVGIGKNGRALAQWDTGKAIPLWALPAFVKEALSTDINNHLGESMGEDDFEPGA